MSSIGRSGGATLLVPEYEASEASRDVGWRHPHVPGDPTRRAATGAEIQRHLSELADEHGADRRRRRIRRKLRVRSRPASIHGEPNAVALPTQALIKRAFATERLEDVTETLESIRAIKTADEIELIRRTNEIAVFGLDAFKEHAVPGKTEVEVMAAVEHAIAVQGHGYEGARWVRGFCTISLRPRPRRWLAVLARASRVGSRRDDVVMLELGTVADGYWSDHTRTVVAGAASAATSGGIRGGSRRPRRPGFAAAKPGATGDDVDRASREACAAAGFTQFPHHTGHGTGFRYHESRPQLVPGSTHCLSAGNVIITEPGIYSSELNGGVRHEDNAVVTDAGAVVLATTDYSFDLA